MTERGAVPTPVSSLFRFRLGRFGAWLTWAFLTPPPPCYASDHKPNYHRARPIAWNLYRCVTCAARREPERWWHLLGWRISRGHYNPFGRRRPW